MQTLIQLLIQHFTTALYHVFPTLESGICAEITPSTQDVFGHYQCNSALKLAKSLGQPPRSIAEKMLAGILELPITQDIQCEIAGPGFINIRFKPAFLSARLHKMLSDEKSGAPVSTKKEKIIIDFSSPNVAKEMHVGHLRTTIIGDCLARLFEFLDFEVLRLNHVGDWGTAFGMLIAHMLDTAELVLKGEQLADLSALVKWYRESKKRFDEDAEFKKRAQLAVVSLQQGDPEFLHAWKIICAISEQAYQEIYDLLDIRIINRGESFYHPLLKPLIDDLTQKNLLEISDGAKCMFLAGFKNREGEMLPFMLQKSDGGYNYATTDLAAIRHRIEVEKGNRLIYVIDAGQSLHLQMLFAAAEKAGYLDPAKVRCDHVAFGLVLGPDGKKFKTRSGDTERLIDLLTTAIDKAKAILQQRDDELSNDILQQKATVLGINAVKYADLSCHRTGDYVFSYDRMLQFEGNTATFLLYSYVRTLSIQRKVGLSVDELMPVTEIVLEQPAEIQLALHLSRFGELLELMVKDLLPHHLTDYLYQLALSFNVFFRDCRVEGDIQQNSRLLLCALTTRVLRQGLTLLGLKTLDRM